MGVILPGVERDGIFPQFFRGIGTGRDNFFVGVGRERFENSLPCHVLMQSNTKLYIFLFYVNSLFVFITKKQGFA